jgi:hypothetical protein
MCPQVNQFTAGGDVFSEFLEGGMSPSQMWVDILGRGNRTNEFFEDAVRRETGTSSPTGAPVLTAKPPDSGSSSLVFAVASGCGGVLLLVAVACWLKLRKGRDKIPGWNSGPDAGHTNPDGVLITMEEASQAQTADTFKFDGNENTIGSLIEQGIEDDFHFVPDPSLYETDSDINFSAEGGDSEEAAVTTGRDNLPTAYI